MKHASAAPSRSAVALGFAAIYVIWGSTYLGIRIAVETLPPFLMAGVRFLIAGALLFAWVRWKHRARPTARQWRDNAIAGGLMLLGGNGLVAWAEQEIPSGIATLIISIGPVFMVLFDWLVLAVGRDAERGARPTGATFLGLALGFIGLALLVGPDIAGASATPLDAWRVAGLVVACVAWSLGSIFMRYARSPAEPLTGSALQMLTGGGWLMLAAAWHGDFNGFEFAAVSGRSFAAWLYLIGVGSLVGFTTYVWLMKVSTPARVSTYAYVNPIVAVLLGWLILNETVGPRMIVASAVIVAGVAIITLQRGRPKVATALSQVQPPMEPAKR
ncbi:EamA family transporter [Horticoccus luteus]|uniref:EamA family transporter n=1 Tax=Horticoccus luteus TaxID=2862869 RepID=A0A8F9TWJ6_9BACT|nr:EamA family transporter [Horticoccus luteus]QYM79311.1 EamA family transporter [Horticoccus luteus]